MVSRSVVVHILVNIPLILHIIGIPVTYSSMSVFLQASSGPSSPKAPEPEIVRRSSNYHPCVWGDHFLAYNTLDYAVNMNVLITMVLLYYYYYY